MSCGTRTISQQMLFKRSQTIFVTREILPLYSISFLCSIICASIRDLIQLLCSYARCTHSLSISSHPSLSFTSRRVCCSFFVRLILVCYLEQCHRIWGPSDCILCPGLHGAGDVGSKEASSAARQGACADGQHSTRYPGSAAIKPLLASKEKNIVYYC